MQRNESKQINPDSKSLHVGPCLIKWDWESKNFVVCHLFYEELGTSGYVLKAVQAARCSEEDYKRGLFNERRGMVLSMKRAIDKWGDRPRSFKERLWKAFRKEIGFPKPHPQYIVDRNYKVPKDFIGRTFAYKGENYTVTNIVWGKAPRARQDTTKGYWKRGEEPGKRKWVEYVEYEPHRGMPQRFVRPKAEFLNKFKLC